jgi:hypothetical protein
MFFTILFVVLLFSKKEKYYNTNYEKKDNGLELFEIGNPYNKSHNPSYYDDYWNKVQKELLYFLIKTFVIVGCMCLDVFYIQYVYF